MNSRHPLHFPALCIPLMLATHALHAQDVVLSALDPGNPARSRIVRVDVASGVVTDLDTNTRATGDGAFAPDGRIYFAEINDHRIVRREPDGSGATNVLPFAARFLFPDSPVFDASGNLYFHALFVNEVWMIPGADPANGLVLILPEFATFPTNAVQGIEIVRGGPHVGALLVATRNPVAILISEPPGAPLRVLVPESEMPRRAPDSPLPLEPRQCVVTDGCGQIYAGVTDHILRFDAEGHFLDALGLVTDPGWFEVDRDGQIYLGKDGGVIRISPDGSQSVVAVLPDGWGVAVAMEPADCSCRSCESLLRTIDDARTGPRLGQSLRAQARAACAALGREQRRTAGQVLCALLHEVDAQAGQGLEIAGADAIRTCVRRLASAERIPLPCTPRRRARR